MKLVRYAVLTAGLMSFLSAGCGGDDDDNFGPVTVQWSLAGSLSPQECARLGAELIEITFFFSQDGSFAGKVEASCQDFETSFDFPAGNYDVTTRMVTSERQPVSSPLFFDEVLVDSGSIALLHSDFPSGAFL